MPEDNTSDATQNTDSSQAAVAQQNKDTTPSQGGSADDKPKSFTQDDLVRLLAKTRREEKAKYEKDLENANKSEVERLKADVAERDAKLAMRDTKDQVTAFLKSNGCEYPEGAFLMVERFVRVTKLARLTTLKRCLPKPNNSPPYSSPTRKSALVARTLGRRVAAIPSQSVKNSTMQFVRPLATR